MLNATLLLLLLRNVVEIYVYERRNSSNELRRRNRDERNKFRVRRPERTLRYTTSIL